MNPGASDVPRIELPAVAPSDPLARLVAWAQRVVFKHPVAAQAAYRALVAEGARYAQTEEGRAWRARLEASEELRRLRPVWELATLNLLEGGGSSALPRQFIDLVAQAVSRADVESVAAALAEAPTSRRGRRR